MDLCSLNLNGSSRVLFTAKICPFRHRHASPDRTFLTYLKWGVLGKEEGCVFEERLSRSKRFLYRSMVVKATGKKNHNSSSSSGRNDGQDPEGDEVEGSHSNKNRSEDLGTPKPHHTASDWRTFRASLVAREQVIPGLSFGARNSLPEAANLVKKGILKSEDFRFFVGYAGWQFDQLREEIDSDYWFVAACSANLITGGSPDSSSGLWEEILQLMGGSYSELSRKPKQDG